MFQQYEVEQFYYREASLLDSRRFAEWLDLFTDDIRYWMPIRRTRTVNEIEQEFTAPGEMAFFDDDREMLQARVAKLETGYAWAEDPPSRTRHHVTNVRIVAAEGEELTVESNFLLYRTRLNSEEDTWMGQREDRLRKVDGAWKLAGRKIYLDQTVLLSRNLTSFF